MAMPNRGPQLMMPTEIATAKYVATPQNFSDEIMPRLPEQKQERKKQPSELNQQQKQKQQFVLDTESQTYYGWNMSQIQVQKFPMYFPRDMIQWEFPTRDLPVVLERITKELRESSIQASLIHEPLSAKLQTCQENAEIYLVFFTDRNDTVSMSLQRHKGDHMVANRWIRHLVDAAKGVLSGNDSAGTKPVTASDVLALERLIERCAAERAVASINNQDLSPEKHHQHPFLTQTAEQMTESAVRDVHACLSQPRRLDLRRLALEHLLAMTDLKRTLRTTAIATSLIVLQGKLPSSSSEMNSQARTIQSILLNVLLTRELPGDRAMLAEAARVDKKNISSTSDDMDLEMRPYFPEVDEDVTAAAVDLPQYYSEFMNELFNLALRILVQSLEVAACFPESFSSTGSNMATQLLTVTSQDVGGKDLYHTLLVCVGHAESKLANGYLACKALRLLASDHPGIKDQIKLDDNAKQSIGNAYQVGQMRHTLLKEESYHLWHSVSQ